MEILNIFILKRSQCEWSGVGDKYYQECLYILYTEVLNTGSYIWKQNKDNILLNWFSFENQSRHIYSYHDILDVNKKGRAPVLHRKIW